MEIRISDPDPKSFRELEMVKKKLTSLVNMKAQMGCNPPGLNLVLC